MKGAARLVTWLLAGIVAYFVIVPVVVAFGLGWALTAGNVDWSGEFREKPTDPVIIDYRGDPGAAFGYAFETVRYRTELGEAEAWVIPTEEPSDLWAVFVHGIGGIRENGYRMLKVLHEAGVPVVMITYRNDRGAPRSDDGLFSFGLTEWKDLDAAVAYTINTLGADRVVIAGESMGAVITGQYLKNGANTDRVVGLALDAPALNFPEVVHGGGRRYWVPFASAVADAALAVSALLRRDLRAAVSVDEVAAFPGPLFIAHGRRDPLVPFSISEKLVARRPDAVFLANDADRHPRAYEVDRDAYAAKLLEWLALVGLSVAEAEGAAEQEG